MKGGLVSWLASESFGVVVWVIASTEMMSAVEEGRLGPDLTSKTTERPTAADLIVWCWRPGRVFGTRWHEGHDERQYRAGYDRSLERIRICGVLTPRRPDEHRFRCRWRAPAKIA